MHRLLRTLLVALCTSALLVGTAACKGLGAPSFGRRR